MAGDPLIQTLMQAGFSGDGLRSAWAITMRESGGRPAAFNGNTGTGDRSWGLFQINTLGPLSARVKQFGLRSERDLLDPLTNAKVAYRMSKGGTDFGPWAVGPNAYKGAPGNAVSKYQDWYAKYPGAKGGGPGLPSADTTESRTQQAWTTGPAGVVAGPNPAAAVAQSQQAALRMLQQSAESVGNTGVDGGGSQLMQAAMLQAQRTLQDASTRQASTEVEAQKYGGTTSADGVTFEAKSPQVAQALKIAADQVGKPYVWGAESPDVGFDCSGLIDYAFKKAGIKIPGRLTTDTARRLGTSVKGSPMEPGDWIITGTGGHMVLYVGGGKVLSAPRRGEVVQYQPVSRFQGKILDVRRYTTPQPKK